jgi:hypothetical protein
VKVVNKIAPLIPWDWPSQPWERMHVDFAGPFLGSMFIIVVDVMSKWPEDIQMSKTTSTHTIAVLRTIFARNGIPSHVVTDNGPQFTSSEFQQFMGLNGIKHIKITPYHPSSNGLAERFVQSFKQEMRASKNDWNNFEKLAKFLLDSWEGNSKQDYTILNRTSRTESLVNRKKCAIVGTFITVILNVDNP